jgi:hypothetical protein
MRHGKVLACIVPHFDPAGRSALIAQILLYHLSLLKQRPGNAFYLLCEFSSSLWRGGMVRRAAGSVCFIGAAEMKSHRIKYDHGDGRCGTLT